MIPVCQSSLITLTSVCLVVCSCVDALIDEHMKDKLLTLHNNARKSVEYGLLDGQPIARSMKPLVWDEELESKAQILADNCTFVHDNVTNRRTSTFAYVGQNIAGANNVHM
ncbi:hypothetical protein MN116_008939 [Schistosoma mekongi]|uniref:SCP domain-containing protein n=1 Tax=Schistosoma mekongi TaxID=38744 RepID=A0AAE1Z534_SCHME|nr:hypothetical protein MN116_008939 [Schistosoma mekongi]